MSRGIFFFLVGLLMALGGFAEPISVNERPTPQIDFSKADYDAAVEAYEKGTATQMQTSILEAADYFDETPVIDYAGGPDPYGYRFRDSDEPDVPVYSWVDITTTGTLWGYPTDHGSLGPIPLPFTYNFYGVDYTEFYIHSDGIITFTDQDLPWYPTTIPTTECFELIAPLWNDLNPHLNGEIWYGEGSLFGQNGMIVSFINVPVGFGTSSVTFQCILFEDGSIRFQYQTAVPDIGWDLESIGIQGSNDGTTGLFISFENNPDSYPFDGLAIEIYLGVPPDPSVVSGYVYDEGTGDPIVGAEVEVNGVQYFTDATGHYEITGLVMGEYPFFTSAEGYYTQIQWMMVEPGPNPLDWYMIEIPPVVFGIEPVGDTLIPSSGGTLTYNAYLTNNTENMWQNVSYWTEVMLPNGNMYGPIIDSGFIILPYMEVYAPNQTLTIPPGAPAGDYTFYANVGMRPGPHLTSDFPFSKSAATMGQEKGSTEWIGSIPKFIPVVSGDVSVAVVELPTEFEMAPVYPNPFNPTATVSIALPEAADLTITVFNLMGQQVAELANGKFNAGVQTFTIDGSNLTSGIYFLRATVPGHLNQVQKVMLVR